MEAQVPLRPRRFPIGAPRPPVDSHLSLIFACLRPSARLLRKVNKKRTSLKCHLSLKVNEDIENIASQRRGYCAPACTRHERGLPSRPLPRKGAAVGSVARAIAATRHSARTHRRFLPQGFSRPRDRHCRLLYRPSLAWQVHVHSKSSLASGRRSAPRYNHRQPI